MKHQYSLKHKGNISKIVFVFPFVFCRELKNSKSKNFCFVFYSYFIIHLHCLVLSCRTTDREEDEKKEKKKDRKEKERKKKRDEEEDGEGEWETVKGGVAIPSVSEAIVILYCTWVGIGCNQSISQWEQDVAPEPNLIVKKCPRNKISQEKFNSRLVHFIALQGFNIATRFSEIKG